MRRQLLGRFVKAVECQENLTTPAFRGEENAECLTTMGNSDLIDIAPKVAGIGETQFGDGLHRAQHGGYLLVREIVEKVANRASSGHRGIESLAPFHPRSRRRLLRSSTGAAVAASGA